MFRVIRCLRHLSNTPLRSWRALSTATTTIPTSDQGILPTSRSPIVSELRFFNSITSEQGQIPTYRVLDGIGVPVEGSQLPEVRLFRFGPASST
ncbi:hypothetical protein EV401DRAFT_733909 [Pisolithus croceorrhizus]|nr:hypothetical protein EV401DRAFT_733909 [Pisolithus croceorrhizus]